jgi:restriction system protein
MSTKGAGSGPQFVGMFGPVLRAVRDLGGSARPQEVYERVAESVGLTPEARSETTSSGVTRYENQIAWARFYLVRAGLLDSSKRGVWSLTEKGRESVGLSPAQAAELFRQVRKEMAEEDRKLGAVARTEVAEEAPAQDGAVTEAPASDYRVRVLEVLQALAPSGFERFCQRLLREAGFQNVVVTGRAGDGGIDGIGILQVNTLVSFKVLFQCKRYVKTVTPSQVRDFRGAMAGRADKGIILTTGAFTVDAKKEAVRDGVPPIELVDGEKLVSMLEELEIGLVPIKAFRVDEPFFLSFGKVVGESADPAPPRTSTPE